MTRRPLIGSPLSQRGASNSSQLRTGCHETATARCSRFEARVRCRFESDDVRRFRRARKIMGEFAIGQSVLRREDPRLLQGRGRFSTISNSPISSMRLSCARHMPMPTSPASTRARRSRCWASMPCSLARTIARMASARCLRWRPIKGAAAARCFCRRGRRLRSTVSCMSATRSRWLSPMRSTSARCRRTRRCRL